MAAPTNPQREGLKRATAGMSTAVRRPPRSRRESETALAAQKHAELQRALKASFLARDAERPRAAPRTRRRLPRVL